jgi:RNA polymerase sigma-B factor
VSLDALTAAEDDGALTNQLADPDVRLAQIDERLTLSPLLAPLSERQQQVLTLRFTVDYSQTRIASLIGVSQMQVLRFLSRSLAQLRALAVEPESETHSNSSPNPLRG